MLCEPKDKADEFNRFFINIGENMASRVQTVASPFPYKNNIPSCLYLGPVTENEIILHINSLKNNTASGPDDRSATLLKKKS